MTNDDSDSDFDLDFVSGAGRMVQKRLNHHIDGGNLLSPSPAATSRGSSTGGTKNRTGSWSRTQNPKTSVGTGDIGDIQVVEEVRRQPSKRKSSVTVPMDSPNISRRRSSRRSKSFGYSDRNCSNVKENSVLDDTFEKLPELSASKVNVKGGKRTRKTVTALKKLDSLMNRVNNDDPTPEKTVTRRGKRAANRKKNQAVAQAVDVIDLEKESEHSDEFQLKFSWQGEILRLKATPRTRIGDLMDEVAAKVEIDWKSLSFWFGTKKLTRGDVISDCGITITSFVEVTRTLIKTATDTSDLIEVKLQTSNRRNVKTVQINKFIGTVKDVRDAYAKEMKLTSANKKKLKFKFDGEVLNDDDILADLDFEGGECIDVF